MLRTITLERTGSVLFVRTAALLIRSGASLIAEAEARAGGEGSVAARMGVRGLLRILRIANVGTLVLLLVAAWRDPAVAMTYYCLCGVVAWRAFLFLNIEKLDVRSGVLRLLNLATCFLFPLAIALGRHFAN